MPLIPCPGCGTPVAEGAWRCPRCRHAFRTGREPRPEIVEEQDRQRIGGRLRRLRALSAFMVIAGVGVTYLMKGTVVRLRGSGAATPLPVLLQLGAVAFLMFTIALYARLKGRSVSSGFLGFLGIIGVVIAFCLEARCLRCGRPVGPGADRCEGCGAPA
jgi:hypothetical protein